MYGEQAARSYLGAPPMSPGYHTASEVAAGAKMVERDRSATECALDELAHAVSVMQERVNSLRSRLTPVLRIVPDDEKRGCTAQPSTGVPVADMVQTQVECLRDLDASMAVIISRLGV